MVLLERRAKPVRRRAAVGAPVAAAAGGRGAVRGALAHAAGAALVGAALGTDARGADDAEGPGDRVRAIAAARPERARRAAARRATRPLACASARRAQTVRPALVRAAIRDARAGGHASAARGVRDGAARDAADGRALLPARAHRRAHGASARRPDLHQPYDPHLISPPTPPPTVRPT